MDPKTSPGQLRIGTRGSPLALAQAHDVKAKLLAAHPAIAADDIEIITIKTTGDRILDRHLMNAGGKGLFTKEIEEALLQGHIDCAVHSSKDMPTSLPEGLVLSTFLPREDVRDAFISVNHQCFDDLPEGATLGTASLRRRALALRQRPDLNIITFRGNVQTRLKKLQDGLADATFLATAGLSRLGMQETISERLEPGLFPPAPAQGTVTVEIREDDERMRGLLAPLHCSRSAMETLAERAFLRALDGSCRTPIAAHTRIDGGKIFFKGYLLSLDGQTMFEEVGEAAAEIGSATALGERLGQAIREKAGLRFFKELQEAINQEIE